MSNQPIVITAEEREADQKRRTVGPLPEGATVVGIIEHSQSDAGAWTVWFEFRGVDVDRARTHGISTGYDRRLADRLVAATEAGVIFDLSAAKIMRDVNSNTYVQASSKVMGKYLNADLTRLGW